MKISEMNSIIFYSVNILILVRNYYYQSIITAMRMVKQKHENVLKFRNLITSKNKTGLIKLCKFIKIIETGICDPD